MAKTLNVNTGNYKVKVPDGGTITLDTGTGQVMLLLQVTLLLQVHKLLLIPEFRYCR